VLHKGFMYNIRVNSAMVVLVGSAIGINYSKIIIIENHEIPSKQKHTINQFYVTFYNKQ